jgi:hypothetical protein
VGDTALSPLKVKKDFDLIKGLSIPAHFKIPSIEYPFPFFSSFSILWLVHLFLILPKSSLCAKTSGLLRAFYLLFTFKISKRDWLPLATLSILCGYNKILRVLYGKEVYLGHISGGCSPSLSSCIDLASGESL